MTSLPSSLPGLLASPRRRWRLDQDPQQGHDGPDTLWPQLCALPVSCACQHGELEHSAVCVRRAPGTAASATHLLLLPGCCDEPLQVQDHTLSRPILPRRRQLCAGARLCAPGRGRGPSGLPAPPRFPAPHPGCVCVLLPPLQFPRTCLALLLCTRASMRTRRRTCTHTHAEADGNSAPPPSHV